MKWSIPAAVIGMLLSVCCYAQPAARILDKHETDSIFAPMEYPVFRAWQYTDKEGLHYLLLLEKYGQTAPKDTLVTNISAYGMMMDKKQPILRWKMRDNVEAEEKSLWFWTKYIHPQDIDGDGYIDPLLVYGSAPKEEGDGHRRLKLLLYYHHRKIAVRAVTGTLDFERSLQYDPAFHELPASIQTHVKQLLQQISKEQDFILAG